MVEEFMKYKKDTEEAVNKTIAEMRERLELRAKEKQVLEEERDRMSGLLSKLQGQINELEGQVSHSFIQLQWTKLSALRNRRPNHVQSGEVSVRRRIQKDHKWSLGERDNQVPCAWRNIFMFFIVKLISFIMKSFFTNLLTQIIYFLEELSLQFLLLYLYLLYFIEASLLIRPKHRGSG